MTRVFGSRLQPGAFFFLQHQAQNKKTRVGKRYGNGHSCGNRERSPSAILLDDFHKLFGKAFAKTAPAFPPLPQRRRRPSSLEKAITNKPPNTKFRLLPGAVPVLLSEEDSGGDETGWRG
jgi:hypothetical protein